MLHGGGPKYIARRGCLNILLENGEGGKYIARRGGPKYIAWRGV